MDGAPHAWGPAPARGRIRARPEDFFVEELLGFAPDGTGSHLLLEVEKRQANTGWVRMCLARLAGVAPRDVGFSGHKDREAVTRQHFTLPATARAPCGGWAGFAGEGFRVLAATAHGRKLKIGTHRANRFRLVIREVVADPVAVARRLAEIAGGGVPNLFGPQRFGREGANVRVAQAWAGGAPPPRARQARSFALSAARSHLFNAVLARRVREGVWNLLLPGDVAMLDGRGSFFRVSDVDARLAARCAALEVHPSGPLHGRGESPAGGEVAAIEQAVLAANTPLGALLEAEGLAQERRSLRLAVRSFSWELRTGEIELSFELPRGAFATAVLHELLADAADTAEDGDA